MKFLKIELTIGLEIAQPVPESTPICDLKDDPEYPTMLEDLKATYEKQFEQDGAKLAKLDVTKMQVIEV